ncbi:hypothetical protein M413DRAFT_29819 [Hebeloma cylindrosporum]|uniref:C2H2-type domain-containing protein n=1 Tax=Hebeloma cylindrosporum TaxID=76867 RepID=A0A0C3C5J7_HEBCY|nr:hypothetical protein M413DRAFT_29819 [Hebeloma cylindrosporum h7]
MDNDAPIRILADPQTAATFLLHDLAVCSLSLIPSKTMDAHFPSQRGIVNPDDMRTWGEGVPDAADGSSTDATYDPASEGEVDELDDDECGSLPPKKKISDKAWLKHRINRGRINGSRTDVYECTYSFDKHGKRTAPCRKRGAANTITRHINAVHFRLRPHPCDICNGDPRQKYTAFGQKQGLRVHINSLHPGAAGYEPFPCKHCGLNFADPSQRNKHYKKDHPEAEIKKRRKDPFADEP